MEVLLSRSSGRGYRPRQDDERHRNRFRGAGLTVSEKKTETMLLRPPDQEPCTSPLVIEAAGQRYRRTTQVLYLGGRVDVCAGIMPEIKRWVRLAWACYSPLDCTI